MDGDINRDWTNVDWKAERFDRDERIVVTASVNSNTIRVYEFGEDMPFNMARCFNDMLAALKQHRKQP